ncbi:MAG: symmetrical bis(5'-nucleosyl)-tetraphosphatase [Gammaproteobacteria bacterium]|jgi:bis(5'-nucleosyl)-tetraphosphatase (symmetrical)|nr:symmetrical bis(5'-nucleosyl)-tetraphosphatase [Gammaproteobacteria bacterium]MDP6616199.1 symmetrical bis(5'-nucleosyl)-tetraphosphatase [Gammaproteobacteria bacterium]MDP6695593.1 symmetrical bis(5'-nucleosyl)-tetraphosphatase [Gammaproteobacteria bacterium]
MAVYAVGDIQGCYDEFATLLDAITFDPGHDRLWLVGDLVNRGPKSLETLRLVQELGDAVVCILGNHDLHLLALALADDVPVAAGNLSAVLQAEDSGELIDWLRRRPLAHFDAGLNTLMVHAGVINTWSVADTLERAGEVADTLAGESAHEFLCAMYGRQPDTWSDDLDGMDRLRFITNCLTRIRYCAANGRLDFDHKLAPGTQPAELQPWFEMPDRATTDTRIVFGHWSTLSLMQSESLLALDTGCTWGGALTAVRLDGEAKPVQVRSRQPRVFED